MIRSRIAIKHRNGCHALAAVKRGDWSNPWSGVLVGSRFGSKNGSPRGNAVWWQISCNDKDCPARLEILAESALNEIR